MTTDTPKIVIAGGSGFLGRILAAHFRKLGYAITILTRAPGPTHDGIREIAWDAHTIGDWARELDDAIAVINLTGRSVNCRYNKRNRKQILESRIHSTRTVGQAIAACKPPPKAWLNTSTATIYKHTLGPAWDESGEIGNTPEAKDEFSIDVATAWERTFNEAQTPATRKVAMRTAMVLGTGKNSVFPMLYRLTRLGLGGKMGDGRQFVSWIHELDFCRAVEWLITHETLSGVVNIAAPNPVTNTEMMRIFRQTLGMPIGLPAAKWMLEIGAAFLRTETELIIKSRRIIPRRLTESGFTFRYPLMQPALEALCQPNVP
ncbi:MAG TPA: TIGR01777 family oxidoreductase [Candidatus Sulfotelmatobacter sp.]|nr:TIGR01777 family oxidoreductase [Candidatus Sulfotelmatobacter sp.]